MWILRPVLWFATAYTIVIIFHEAAHAVVAQLLGLNPTLYQFWVNFESDTATQSQLALVGVAGPIVSLVVGLAAWVAYRRLKNSRAGLPLCLLAASGVSNFFGNLMSAAFVGDFSNAAIWLGVPSSARYAASLVGVLSLSAVLFVSGTQLRRYSPNRIGRFVAASGVVILPVIAGTAIVVLINQPVSIQISFGAARAGESMFWTFALIGALITRNQAAADETSLRFHWADGVVALVTLLIVRIMVQGIDFT